MCESILAEISETIALIALFVATGSLWVSFKNSKKTKNLSLKEVESLRIQIANAQAEHSGGKEADMSARMYKHSKNSWRVKVFNKGPSGAYDVRLEFDDENHFLFNDYVKSKFPMKTMEKGQSVELLAGVFHGSPAKDDITILWRGAENSKKSKTVTLTI